MLDERAQRVRQGEGPSRCRHPIRPDVELPPRFPVAVDEAFAHRGPEIFGNEDRVAPGPLGNETARLGGSSGTASISEVIARMSEGPSRESSTSRTRGCRLRVSMAAVASSLRYVPKIM